MEPTAQNESQEPSQVWPVAVDDRTVMDEGSPVVEKLDARGMGIRVTNCGACDGTHDDLKVNEYARPLGPFTHWFMCPTLHDPVNLTLAMLKTGDGLELDGPVCRKLAEAQIAGRWMVIICYVDSSGGADALKYQRNGHKFPSGDVYPSKQSKGLVGLLMEDLEREFGPAQPVEMKQVVPHPLRSLLGKAENAVQNSLGDRVTEAMHPLPPQ